MTVEDISPEISLDEIYRIAIAREVQSQAFYTEASKRVQTSKAREVLIKLAQDERGHELALTQQLQDLLAMKDVERAMMSDM